MVVVRPPSEAKHPNTVSKEDEIIGHIPLQMSQLCWQISEMKGQ